MANDDRGAEPGSDPKTVFPSAAGPAPGRGPVARRAIRSGTYLLAGLSAVTVLVLACIGGNREFFQDESYVVWLDRSGWGHIAEYIRFEPSAPLYHYAMKLWIDLGGESEVWVRAQSGLCYLLSFPVIWWLGRPLFSRAERLAIFVLMIGCKLLGYDPIFARFYEMMFLESCVALLSFVGLFTGRLPRRVALPLLALANFAGFMTHYYFAFCLLAQGVAYLAFYRWRRFPDFLLGAVAPVIAFAGAWGPSLRAQLSSGRFNGDRTPPPLSALVSETYFGRRWLFLILPALLLLTLVEHRRGRWSWTTGGGLRARAAGFLADERPRVLAVLWSVTLLGPFLASTVLGEQFLKSDPYIMLTTLPFVAILALMVNRSNRLLRVAVGLTMVCVIGSIEVRYRVSLARHGFPEDGSRAAVEKMLGKGHTGDMVVCTDNYFTKIDYYLRNTRTGVRAEILGFPKGLERRPGWSDTRVLQDMAAFRAYAREYAAEAAGSAEALPGCRVWVLDASWLPEFTAVVKEAFDATMDRVERIEVPGGVGYSEIVGYEPRRNRPEIATGSPPQGSPPSGEVRSP